MSSLKTVTLIVVMAAVGYGVYTSLHKRPPAEPPATLPENWAAGPDVQMPATATNVPPVALTPGTASPPPFVTGGNSATSAPLPLGPAPLPLGGSPGSPSGTVQATYGVGINPLAPPTGTGGEEGLAVANDSIGANSGGAKPASGDTHAQFVRAFEAAQLQADLGKLAEAHLELSQWYDHPDLSDVDGRQLAQMLDRLAGTVIYSHKHHLLEKPYEVKPGETLDQIAQQHQVPWQLLAKINGIDDPASVRPGETLKVVRGPFNAVVDARQYRLTLFLQGRYAGRFAIGLGRDAPLREGDFSVCGVLDNPIYRGSDVTIEPGDPNNPYGRVFIDLGSQFGIHGTNDPRNIGTSSGRGCIMLRSEDIAHVQNILSVGSRVIVRR